MKVGGKSENSKARVLTMEKKKKNIIIIQKLGY